MDRFETAVLFTPDNPAALADMRARWIDRQHASIHLCVNQDSLDFDPSHSLSPLVTQHGECHHLSTFGRGGPNADNPGGWSKKLCGEQTTNQPVIRSPQAEVDRHRQHDLLTRQF